MLLRVVRALVRGVGWLLTPAIVAATSAGALWAAARLGTGLESANLALAAAVGAALGAGTAVFVWWVLSLRHARHHARRTARRPRPADDLLGAPPTAATVAAPSAVDEAAD